MSATTAFIIAAAALVVGIGNAVKPDLAYKLSRWKYRNPEAAAPSNTALVWGRIGGCVAIIAGIVFLVIGFTR